MLAKITSGAAVGLDATLVEVEVDIPQEGLPSFTMVGTQWENLGLVLGCNEAIYLSI